MKTTALLFALSLATYTPLSHASERSGEVQIPLSEYQRLLAAGERPDRAPAPFAIGRAKIDVRVDERDGVASAAVRAKVAIDVLEPSWVLIPLLPAATPVDSVMRGKERVELVPGPDGLSWATREAGGHTLVLRYRVDARSGGRSGGFVLPLPTPAAAATELTLDLPGPAITASVIPAAAVETRTQGSRTLVRATVPSARGVQITWRRPTGDTYTLSRADYQGVLRGRAVEWRARLAVEIEGDRPVRLPVLPASVTLRDLTIDGEPRPIGVRDGFFETEVSGSGVHAVGLAFEVGVTATKGPPTIGFDIPAVPVSHFELELPGEKELRVSPDANISRTTGGGLTHASFHVPMSTHVALEWTEAVPGDARADLRASAALFHAAHVEEDVLYVRARAAFEIRRGELAQIELGLPAGVQVNEVTGDRGIADWRVTPGDEGATLQVYLDHPLTGAIALDVAYDRSLRGRAAPAEPFPIPLLHATQVARQRGMVALLATRELALRPVEEGELTRVGETQLPSDFRAALEKKIDHTYKYTARAPRLTATVVVPERTPAKLDARVDSLVSLTDVGLEASSSALVRVKSGVVERLSLTIPATVNVLRLTAPSLRSYDVETRTDGTAIDVEFTQDMEGDLRIELGYEWVAQGDADLRIATPSVGGAEAEQGRIGIESRAAVELGGARARGLSELDPAELPRQLILKTTHPILLAYKYVQADPPYELSLATTRHAEVDVPLAAIDTADYRTLVTEDGVAVTTARFWVRNTRRQFMRLRLPAGSEVWAARVDGVPEIPARASETPPPDATRADQNSRDGSGDGAEEILIKIKNASDGFPVELVYTTQTPPLGRFGTLELSLPGPEMIVTRSAWTWFVPEGDLRFGTPVTSLRVAESPVAPTAGAPSATPADEAWIRERGRAPGGLTIDVPSQGRRFDFEKLYASQTDDPARVAIPYVRAGTSTLAQIAIAIGLAVFWISSLAAVRARARRKPLLLAAIAGLAMAACPTLGLEIDPTLGISISLVALAVGAALQIAHARVEREPEPATASPDGTAEPPRS